MRSASLAHAALPLASLLAAASLSGCRSLGSAPKPNQSPGDETPTAAGSMGGPRTRLTTRLDNGVSVVVEENHAAPLVSVQVWVAAGAADDPPALAGAAHLLERLLFRGTKRRAPGAAAREIEATGGALGAWTGPDETVYHATVASPFFEQGLDVLADALTNPTFDPAEVAAQKKIVLSEIGRTGADPAAAAVDLLRATAFPDGGYGRPLLGTPDAVAARTRAELVSRFAETYVGANLTVVVVGDVDARAARAEIGRAFAGVPRGKALTPPPSPPPPSAEARALVSPVAATEAVVAVGFRVTTPSVEDAAALDLIGALLARGDQARLARELIDNRQIASAVRAFTFRGRSDALLALTITPAPQRTDAAAQAAVDEALRLGREEVPADELQRARAALEGDLARGEAGIEGHARRLGFSAVVAGDLDDGNRYRARLESLDPSGLRSAAAKLERTESLVVAAVEPAGRGGAASAAETARLAAVVSGAAARAERPAPAAAVPEVGGDVVRAVTPSGVRVLVLRDPAAPSVAVEASWAGGARAEDAGNNGAGALIAALLDRGTRTRSAADIAAAARALGGALAGFADRNHLGLRAEFLPGGWARGLALIADCLQRPTFPAGEVDGSRRVVVDRARGADADPAQAAWRLFRETLWPGHPFRLDPQGSPESLASLGRMRLFEHYRRHYPISRLVVSVVGDVDPQAVVAELTRLFEGAPAGVAPPEPPPEPVHTQPVAEFRAAGKDVAQLVLGYPGPPPRDPDRLAIAVLAEVLGVRGGRLDTAGTGALQLSVTAAAGVDPGYLAIALSCPPAAVDAAVATLRERLAQVAAGGVTPDEVTRAARRLAGERARALGSRAAIADALALDEEYGLGLMAYRRVPAALARLTAADVSRAARRVLDPQHEVIAVVRPAPPAPRAAAKAKPIAKEDR